MIDYLQMRTPLKVNEQFISDQMSNNPHIRFQKYAKNYHMMIYIHHPKGYPSPFTIFKSKSYNNPDQMSTMIQVNPSHYHSIENVYNLLIQCLVGFEPDQLRISRLDFAVDIDDSFQDVIKKVYRKKIRKHLCFTSSQGLITSICFGKDPVQCKLYDKRLELSQRAKKVSPIYRGYYRRGKLDSKSNSSGDPI